ncbi:unnamed protein product [Diatraea saccharalis]|uniref:Uncharacterized protein n=1 Tax=Diatraea saccharalis TaxID=40085 RepID=A0A9N9WH38_9NEOP|nr:unnamed protein product [Diatraea saccharalis]
MNNQLIEKIIESSGVGCPQLTFANPLLDRKVAKALSKSFVKILDLAKENCNINNNLRISILENIRKLCTTESEGHLPVDESLTEMLTGLYIDRLASTAVESTDKDLDAFLIRNFKSLQIDPRHETNINPEIVKALLNLNENGVYLEVLSKDIVHLNTNQSSVINILKTLWETDNVNGMYDDISIKMKPEIEKLLLQTCHNILLNRNIDIGNLLNSNDYLTQLIKRSAVSSECFQICCGVLNFLFVMTNFDSTLQLFIKAFVNLVKVQCPKITFSVLYPVHINYIVVLLDIDINELPEPLRCDYITPTIKYLQNVRDNSEYDFIMLLSHFPQWFDIYFQNTESK